MDYIVIINKTDLQNQLDHEEVKKLAGDKRLVTTSLLKDEGVDELEEAIASLFFEGSIEISDITYVSNARHIALLNQAKATITDAIEAAHNNVPVDMIQIDVTRTWEILGEIIGDTVEESLIDQLFSQFCLGK
jgi:tRNA modification GTPase